MHVSRDRQAWPAFHVLRRSFQSGVEYLYGSGVLSQLEVCGALRSSRGTLPGGARDDQGAIILAPCWSGPSKNGRARTVRGPVHSARTRVVNIRSHCKMGNQIFV